MSCYIVSQRTIQAIATVLMKKFPVSWSNNSTISTAQDLGQALLDLNYDAYKDRYPHAQLERERYCHSNLTLSDISAYKVVSGFLYQCSEGDFVESSLYRLLENLKIVLADSIIARIPGFDDLPRDL